MLSTFVYLCIPNTHKLYPKDKISIYDIRDSQFAMFTPEFTIRHKFYDSCKLAGFEPNIEVSSNDCNSLREIANSNNLLYILPKHTVNHDNPRIRYIPFPCSRLTWDIYLISTADKSYSEHMNIFYKYLKNRLLIVEKTLKSDSR